jgi:hypothetical protein
MGGEAGGEGAGIGGDAGGETGGGGSGGGRTSGPATGGDPDGGEGGNETLNVTVAVETLPAVSVPVISNERDPTSEGTTPPFRNDGDTHPAGGSTPASGGSAPDKASVHWNAMVVPATTSLGLGGVVTIVGAVLSTQMNTFAWEVPPESKVAGAFAVNPLTPSKHLTGPV